MYGQGYGGFRGNGMRSGGGFRRGPRRPFNRGPREMTKIKCSECGKEDEVPFKPIDNITVLCKECYSKKKGFEPRDFKKKEEPKQEESAESSESFDESDDFEEDQEKI